MARASNESKIKFRNSFFIPKSLSKQDDEPLKIDANLAIFQKLPTLNSECIRADNSSQLGSRPNNC
jgi:hypothetical protein